MPAQQPHDVTTDFPRANLPESCTERASYEYRGGGTPPVKRRRARKGFCRSVIRGITLLCDSCNSDVRVSLLSRKKRGSLWATSEGSRNSGECLLRFLLVPETHRQELTLPAPLAGGLVEVLLHPTEPPIGRLCHVLATRLRAPAQSALCFLEPLRTPSAQRWPIIARSILHSHGKACPVLLPTSSPMR
jgi:hypothetical protein